MAISPRDERIVDDVETARTEDERDRRRVHRREERRHAKSDHDAANCHRDRRGVAVGIAPDERVPPGVKEGRGEERGEDEKGHELRREMEVSVAVWMRFAGS